MEDEKIVGMFFERDEQALCETEKKYRGLCLGIAKNILNSLSDAEECFSDTLMALWNAIPPERPSDLKAYVCRVERNIAMTRLDYLTAQKRARQCEVPIGEFEEILPDGFTEEALRRVEFEAMLNGFLEKLAPEQRKVFLRRYFFFDPVAEIAEDMKMSESKVKSMLFRTRKKLKSYLTGKEHGL